MGYHSCLIERLPDDILIHILQSLPLIDAVATRTLSRRWKNLSEKSCAQRLNLCFDLNNLVGVGEPVPAKEKESAPEWIYYRKNLALRLGYYYGLSSQIVEDFIKGADMIVQCRQGEEQYVGQGVKSLEIRFPLCGKHSCHIYNWILSTVTSITKQLILVLDLCSDPSYSCTESKFYKFPFKLLLKQKNLTLEYLQLEFVSTKLPKNFGGFTTLRTLKLNCTDLSQEDAHKLLINCPLLEFLKIQKCDNLVALQVPSPLPHLKVLILLECNYLRKINLWAENLSSFEYNTIKSTDHVKLRGCHNLKTVAACSHSYVGRDYFRPLSDDFPFASKLYLQSHLEDLGAVLQYNLFAHLKYLAVFMTVYKGEKNLQHMSSLLNVVAPILEELELHLNVMGSAKCYKVRNEAIDGNSYNNLKRVAFTGFTGETGQTMLAKYFLVEATRLQLMTLDPKMRSYRNFDTIEEFYGQCPPLIDKRKECLQSSL